MSPDAPPPSDTAPDDRASPFWRHVSRAAGRFDDLLAFLAVPILTSLLQFENVRRLLAADGREFSINLGAQVPSPTLDLWSFVDPPEPVDPTPDPVATTGGSSGGVPGAGPAGGATVDVPVGPGEIAVADADFGLLAAVVPLLVSYAVAAAVVYAIYVGGIDRRLRGEPAAPLECLTRFAGRFLGYLLALFAAVVLVAPFLLAFPGLFLLAIPGLLVLAYLFYAAPFLFVVADAPLVDAFVRSYRLAVAGGPYLSFALWHLGVTLFASVVLSLLVIPGGPFALLVGLAVTAPLSLVLTATTVSFLGDLVEPARGTP